MENNTSLDKVKFVDKKSHNFLKKTGLTGNEILVTKRGEIGKVYLFKKRTAYATVAPNLYLLKLNKKINSFFLYCYLLHGAGNTQLIQKNASSTLGALYKDDVKSILVPLPPLAEQQAIAEALGEMDALLAAQRTRLAKQRAVKQGLLQGLLSGEKRLPGFAGEWEVKRLGEICTLKNGFAFKSSSYTSSGIYSIITITNVQDGRLDITSVSHISDLPATLQAHHKLVAGDLLISMTGNVGRVCIVNQSDCLLNQRVGKIVPQHVDAHYLYSLLRSGRFLSEMISQGKGGAQPNIGVSDILSFEALVPIDRKEQRAIADVLTEADAHLAALEAEHAKTQLLKQGMMQNLLTGKIRLV